MITLRTKSRPFLREVDDPREALIEEVLTNMFEHYRTLRPVRLVRLVVKGYRGQRLHWHSSCSLSHWTNLGNLEIGEDMSSCKKSLLRTHSANKEIGRQASRCFMVFLDFHQGVSSTIQNFLRVCFGFPDSLICLSAAKMVFGLKARYWNSDDETTCEGMAAQRHGLQVMRL